MTTIREPAVAGMFYPADAGTLGRMVDDYLAAAAPGEGPAPKAIVAPHAGYPYSGPVAASVYRAVAPRRDTIRRVVLLGPAHRVPFRGLALPDVDALRTPLGDIPVDADGIAAIADLPQVGNLAVAHAREHSLEVQLPFLQRALGEFRIVPLVVGEAEPDEVAEVLDRLWGGPETLVVISSDLSHFHDEATAQRLDGATSRAIEELRPDAIGFDSACGRTPLNGLLTVARRRGLIAKTLDRRTSADTAGSPEQVVGYGAYAFIEPGTSEVAA